MPDSLRSFLYRCMAVNAEVGADVVDDQNSHWPTSAVTNFDEDVQAKARYMGRAYELLYCLENDARTLIQARLLEEHGIDWWSKVSEPLRQKAEKLHKKDTQARWHSMRGNSVLYYLDFPDLSKLILEHWDDFESLFGDRLWVQRFFEEINATRRALAHTGELGALDVERMELRVREWISVVG